MILNEHELEELKRIHKKYFEGNLYPQNSNINDGFTLCENEEDLKILGEILEKTQDIDKNYQNYGHMLYECRNLYQYRKSL